ncbi:MAG TPA: N-6 DNA methylase, partial [Candidatus Cloacimonadota bacterium]|nr:N-6 DNA methylase [Candidatus Cloacimonadota bacterium]
MNEEIIKTFFNQVYTIEKNTDLRNDLSKFTNYLLLKDIPNKINLSDITNLLNEEDLVSIRKNLILKIRQEIKKRGRDTIGYLSNEGLRIAVAASAIYEEQYGLPGKLRNAIAHGSGPENVVDFLKNEDLKNLPPELINLIVIYLSTYKVFKGKDLVQFYLDLIEDWGLVWNVATPLWISKLMARLASPKVNDKVWDPAAGTGRTLLEILEVNPFADIYGCEINPDAYKLARAVLSLEKVVSSGILNCDALNSGTGPYEIVISDPPKGKIQYKNAKGTLNTDPDGALTFLKQMVSRTIEGGTIVALITDSSLLRRFRLQILPEVWIKAIISLPTASFGSYTSATHSLILLNKKKIDDKEEPFPARFLDSEEIIKQIKIDLPGIDEAETYQELNDRIEDLVNVKSLSSSRIGKDVFHNDLYSIDVFTVNY